MTNKALLTSMGLSKLEKITGDSKKSLIFYEVFLPVKFADQNCTKKIDEKHLPAFYVESLSASNVAEPRLPNLRSLKK